MDDIAPIPWDPAELASAARQRLSPVAATYFETTAVFPPAHDNERAWARWRLVPRVGRDVAAVSSAVELLGSRVAAPVLLAPCAFAGQAHVEGELAVARAAAENGAIFVVSSTSTYPIAEIASSAPADCWLQVYVPREEEPLAAMLGLARDTGYRAIVVTLDAPVASMRVHGYVPDRVSTDPLRRARPNASPLNPSVTWETIERIATLSPLPVLVKGVLHPDDARSAVAHGARGVIVSNHGSRQLDGVVPTADVLERVSAACGDAVVLVDGGIRTGRDVLRALSLGAHGAMIGRPYLWALAIAGEAGVSELLRRLRLERENALALTGCVGPAEANRGLLDPAPGRI